MHVDLPALDHEPDVGGGGVVEGQAKRVVDGGSGGGLGGHRGVSDGRGGEAGEDLVQGAEGGLGREGHGLAVALPEGREKEFYIYIKECD